MVPILTLGWWGIGVGSDLNVGLTLKVHFSEFDSPKSERFTKISRLAKTRGESVDCFEGPFDSRFQSFLILG